MSYQVPWSQHGSLTTFQNGSVNLQKEFPSPNVYTLQFFIDGDPARTSGGGANNTTRRCYAVITWAVGGNFVRRVVSVYNGCSVSGVGQAVSVQMIDRSLAISGAPIVYTYNVSIQVTPGTRAAQQQPPILDLLGASQNVSAAASVTFDFNSLCLSLFGVSDVGVISCYVTASAFQANQAVPFADLVAEQIAPGSIFTTFNWNPLQVSGWIPISAGVGGLRFSAGPAVAGSIPVYAVLGIDG